MKEEDGNILDKKMKRLCYLDILKEGFSAYSSPVMLISRKMTNDKRVVTDLRDTFVLLGSSKCEVMSMLDIKDTFHSSRLTENMKQYCGILPYFRSASYLY